LSTLDDNELPVEATRPDPALPGGIPLFFLAIGLLAIVRIALGYVSFPLKSLATVDLLIAALFLAVPILALFFAANARWQWKTAAGFVVGGVAVQVGIITLGNHATLPSSVAGILTAVAQGALTCWCAGLGALLATLIKEKNIILPIAIFLAAYDFFLILTPWGYGEKLMKVALPVFRQVAAQIPSASAVPTHGLATPGAYVGMADLVFLSMFFIALFRFQMRTRQTLYAVVPALIVYLYIVMMLGNKELFGFKLGALPAMVPIGLAVLIVNWREFKLNKDEKLSTIVLAVLAVGFLAFAATRPKPQPELERGAPAPAHRAPQG
jgi:hypothetical protein